MIMDKKPSQYSKAAQVGVIIGIVLVFFGLVRLSEMFLGTWWGTLQSIINTVFSLVWPIALIVLGVVLVWAARTGKFKGASFDSGRPFRRSMIDKRLAGVCGGIAYYLGVDSTIVRIIAVILLILSPFITLLVYFVAMVLMPRV